MIFRLYFSRIIVFYIVIITTAISGCDNSSTQIQSVVNRANSVLTGDRLPEDTLSSALERHGFAQLLAWAKEGDMKAQHYVAVAYYEGKGVPINFAEASKWALRAANQGVPHSQLLLGRIRLDEGLQENNLLMSQAKFELAYMWFSLASAQGLSAADEDLKTIVSIYADQPALQKEFQQLAAEWRQCNHQSCWDFEPDTYSQQIARFNRVN